MSTYLGLMFVFWGLWFVSDSLDKVSEAIRERPEDPIDDVIQTTEEAWENNDLYISGDRLDNTGKNDIK